LVKALFTAALLFLPQIASADEAEAEACLRTKVWDGYADGWAIRTMTATTLTAGATRNYLVTFYKGNEYQIQACADASSQNVDLVLYDLNGEVAKRDESTDRQPKLLFKPTKTSTYYIVVHARQLEKEKTESGISVAVTYR
jgi:hypothetical protein